MIVYFIKCFRKIYNIEISYAATIDVTIQNVSDCTNSIITAKSLFESKLIIRSCEERANFINAYAAI